MPDTRGFMFTLAPPRHQSDCPVDHPALEDLPVLRSAACVSPYLARLCRMRGETIDALTRGNAESFAEEIIARVADIPHDMPEQDAMRTLRQAKADIHLTLAHLDLSCIWDWNTVTSTFSRFADAAIDAALRLACARAASREWVNWTDKSTPLPGLFILALGKLGAFELNYSSDVDLVAMFDPESFPAGSVSPGDGARRIIQSMSQILDATTEHGYVLRVDLRLRPDPRSTPAAMSTRAAEIYYESRGQNWERMAYIKARPCAGDTGAGDTFLDGMEPFIWRRHLDFWALEDIRSIKQQIDAKGGHLDLSDDEFDVKLGPGGIREIEFFAQTQQLIHGGRNPALRQTRTIDALAALAAEGHIEPETAEQLTEVYGYLRGIEHRIQMLNDEHTHTLSAQSELRDRVATLCGHDTLDQFDTDVRGLRQIVNDYFADLFKGPEELSGISGNLVFAGVDIDPGTVRTLARYSFSNPESIIADFQNWHRGGIRATRSSRGRQLLTSMERRLFQLMAETGNPDTAYEGLRAFLGGLSAGIQTLSLLAANPEILKDIISIFSVAPKMARDLADRPELLEALLEGGFLAPLTEDTCGNFEAINAVPGECADDFECAMNEVRRQFRDAHFRIRFKLLQDPSALPETGPAFTDLADACIRALTPAALKQAERSLGPAPGRWVICGLGKLGSFDLTADSDLDLMVIFEPDDSQSAPQFFARATQRLITALSAQTEEGLLYEADMQLRPSGRAGPVAVRFSAFAEYYRKDAWTWEHMALTRLRPIAGDPELMAMVREEKETLLSIERPVEMIRQDAWDMRERLLKDRPAKHDFDLKLVKGGMIDIEFLAQTAQLMHPDRNWESRNTRDALELAGFFGVFPQDEVESLLNAYTRMSGVLAFQRTALQGPTRPEDWPDVLKDRTARALNFETFQALEDQLHADNEAVWQIFCEKMQPAATES